MDRDDGLDSGQGDGPRRCGGPHGEVAANGQHRNCGSPGAHEGHVAKEVRVAGVVNPRPVFELDQPSPAADLAGRLRALAGEGDAAGMDRVEHGQLDPRRLDGAALVHADRLHAKASEVDLQLVAADDGGARLGQLYDVRGIVADMVEMTMCRSHDVDLLCLPVGLGVGRCSAPAIDPQPLVGGRSVEDPAVTEPRDAQGAHGHRPSSPIVLRKPS